jgi:hypothetical protein
MKKIFKVMFICLLSVVSSNIYSQSCEVKSYLLIEKDNTFLKAWVKNKKELKNGYSLNTFILVSDGICISKPWSEAVIGFGKTHKNWYFESLIGIQNSEMGIDLMVKPSWSYKKNKFSVFNSWKFGTQPDAWGWTAHIDYKIYKDSYIGVMSRRKHGTGIEIGVVVKQFEFQLAPLWDTEVGEFKLLVGLKFKIESIQE